MLRIFCFLFFIIATPNCFGQVKWQNVDSLFQPLPKSVHVFYTTSVLDSLPFKAYYVVADLKDKNLIFTTDTTHKRRLAPTGFFEKNDQPLLVVNGTFFSFETSANLNVVIKDGKTVSYNVHSLAGKGKDTMTYRHPFTGAIGINKKRKADVAWILSDSTKKISYASQWVLPVVKDSVNNAPATYLFKKTSTPHNSRFTKWKMQTAIGGGPVLLQNGEIKITNNEELKFGGKAINDKHPRTAMGYTSDGKLIILVVEGRNPAAAGATLIQEAQLLKELGCVEALNLDGGGSSCLLINGKETIVPSDKKQRAVPAVFIIKAK